MKKKNEYNFVFRNYPHSMFYTTVLAYNYEHAVHLMFMMFPDANYFSVNISAQVLKNIGLVRISNNTNDNINDIPELQNI